MPIIKFAIPKGHLQNGTYEILQNGGYKISSQDKTYRPSINDPKIKMKMLRPQEIPIFVAEGLHDVGITGLDWVKETDANVKVLLDLEFGKTKMVLAVTKDWEEVDSLAKLLKKFWSKGQDVRVSTEYLNTAVQYIKANQIYKDKFGDRAPLVITPWWKMGEHPKVSIFLSFGATEAKPPEDADAVIEVYETGATLEQNNLKVIETISESTAVLIANNNSLNHPQKQEKIYDILTLLKGVVDARKKLHIFVNVRKENLKSLVLKLPALKKPTISPLSKEGWYSINTVIDRKDFFEILPTLRRLSQGLVIHEPRQILTLKEIFEGMKNVSKTKDDD